MLVPDFCLAKQRFKGLDTVALFSLLVATKKRAFFKLWNVQKGSTNAMCLNLFTVAVGHTKTLKKLQSHQCVGVPKQVETKVETTLPFQPVSLRSQGLKVLPRHKPRSFLSQASFPLQFHHLDGLNSMPMWILNDPTATPKQKNVKGHLDKPKQMQVSILQGEAPLAMGRSKLSPVA